MKRLLVLLAILLPFYSFSTDYYFSQTSGNDGFSGTQALPFKSLAKFNSLSHAGNRFYFQCNNTWYGSLVMNSSGTSGNNIFISSYGTGAKPIISGFTLISAWDSPVSSVYTSTAAASTLSTCNILSINNTNYSKARLPKTGYYPITSTNGTTTITNTNISTSVVSANNGSQVAVRELMYETNNHNITNVSGNTVTFDPGEITAGWGFILMNDIKMCTQTNEWVYNTSTKKLSINAASVPTNVQIPTVEHGIDVNGKQYVTFDNLDIRGFNTTGVYIRTNTIPNGIRVNSCDFSFIGVNAIDGYGDPDVIPHGNAPNLRVTGCTFTDIGSRGIWGASSDNGYYDSNTLTRIGSMAGMGSNGDNSYTGIIADGDNSYVGNNRLYTIGYNGVHFDGNGTIVEKNLVDGCNTVKTDGAAYYAFPVQGDLNPTTRIVRNNIALNCFGGGELNPNGEQGMGYYADGKSGRIRFINNTVSTALLGYFVNGGSYVTVDSCLSFDCSKGYYLIKLELPITNDSVMNNNFITKSTHNGSGTGQYSAYFEPGAGIMPTTFYATNNCYGSPINQTDGWIWIDSLGNNRYKTLSQLKATAFWRGQDANSVQSSKSVSDVSEFRFIYNSLAGSATTNLGANYVDPRGNAYPGTITLAPYASRVLIINGASNTPPTCTAIPSATITLPTNSVSLNGVAASTMGGSIVSWSWVKTSGGAATITNASAQNTTVTGLVQGSYVFTVTATDNNGLTCTATKSVTVNAALVIPTANAGSNQTITLPTNSVTLSGSGSGGTINSYLWSLLSGACVGCNFSSPTSTSTNFTGLIAGIYSVRFRVGNDDGNFGYDTVQITVNPAPVAPTCSAGTTPVTITLPTNTVGLSATGSGVNPVSFLWERTSGPLTATIVSPTSASTTATGLANGTHTFRITVTDNVNGLTCQSNKTVTVNSAPNIPPVVTVSDNQIITLPTNSVTVSGSAVISSGTLASYLWEYVSGPVTYTITSPATASTTITGLVAGTYRFSLKVTDSNGLIGRDTLIIQVNAAGTEYIPGIRALNASVIQTGVQMMFAVDKPTDMQYFIIQKKTTGNYSNLSGQIKPSMAPIYKYFDANPTLGDSFYRVKALEKNGKTWYSNVVQIKKN